MRRVRLRMGELATFLCRMLGGARGCNPTHSEPLRSQPPPWSRALSPAFLAVLLGCLTVCAIFVGCTPELSMEAALGVLRANTGNLCEYREEILLAAELIPTCTATPTAVPTPEPPPPYHEPSEVLATVDVTGVYDHTGVCVCTGGYLADYGIAPTGGCLSFISASCGDVTVDYKKMFPLNERRGWDAPHCACPHGVENWINWGDHGPQDTKEYIYVTGYKEKQVTANEAYILRSITRPALEIVRGFPNGMPAQKLDEKEQDHVIVFIKSLGATGKK